MNVIGCRYNIIITNIAQSINKVFKSIKDFPICTLMKFLIIVLQHWFYDRHSLASLWNQQDLINKIEKILKNRYDASQHYNVFSYRCTHSLCTGNGVINEVDLHNKSYMCNVFNLDLFPCIHACAMTRKQGMNITSLCDHNYLVKSMIIAYDTHISPIGAKDDWTFLKMYYLLLLNHHLQEEKRLS